MRNLSEEMILKERIVNVARQGEQARRHEARRLEGNEFGDRDEFLESRESTRW